MEKIVIVIEDGMVTDVYGSLPINAVDIEILDMDVTDPDERSLLEESLETAQQTLTSLF